MKTVCVFCGSMPGNDPAYMESARELGRILATDGITVVYGGGRTGIMGALADSALQTGGSVTGVIPRAMVELELAHKNVTELHVVKSMHERKAMMYRMSDAFIALPGGFGTLDELFESLTWSQLGIHEKPCGLLNVKGYFDPLLIFLDKATGNEFIHTRDRSRLVDDVDSGSLINKIRMRLSK